MKTPVEGEPMDSNWELELEQQIGWWVRDGKLILNVFGIWALEIERFELIVKSFGGCSRWEEETGDVHGQSNAIQRTANAQSFVGFWEFYVTKLKIFSWP